MLKNWKFHFALIWSGQTISLFTSSLVQYVFLWHLTAVTKSPAVLSIATLVGFLPTAIIGPFLGNFIDRHNRKTIMVCADGAIALVTLAAALIGFAGHLSIPVIYLVLFLRALGSALHSPCLQAVTPQLVPSEKLAKCNGYTTAFQSISLLLSPVMAALLFAGLPLPSILLLDCIGALAGIFTLLPVPIPTVDAPPATHGVLKDAAASLRLLHSKKGLWAFTMICCLFTFFYLPCSSYYPLMVMDYFGKGAFETGLVESLFCVGMLAGSLLLGVWGGTKDKVITMFFSTIGFGAFTVWMGFLPPTSFWWFAGLTGAIGFTAPFFNSLFMTLLQQKVAPEEMGRIFSITGSLQSLAGPVGLALAGIAARWVPLIQFFVLSGIAIVVCGLLMLWIPSVRRLDTPDEPNSANV